MGGFQSWCDRLTELDVLSCSGGQVATGRATTIPFVFFDDPAGNHIELSAEMEKVLRRQRSVRTALAAGSREREPLGRTNPEVAHDKRGNGLMPLLSYEHDGRVRLGVVEGDRVRAFANIDRLGPAAEGILDGAPHMEDGTVTVDAVRLLPCSPTPRKILCVGLNYAEHIEETGRERPEYPVLFPKYASTSWGQCRRSSCRPSPARSTTVKPP